MAQFTPYQSTLDISNNGTLTKAEGDHRYDALRNLESHSDSDTDAEDQEDEGQIQPRRERTLWSRVKAFRSMLDTALLLVIVSLLVERRLKSRDGENTYLTVKGTPSNEELASH